LSTRGRDGPARRQSTKALPHHLLLGNPEYKGRSTAGKRISIVSSPAVKVRSGFDRCEHGLVYHFVPRESTANAKKTSESRGAPNCAKDGNSGEGNCGSCARGACLMSIFRPSDVDFVSSPTLVRVVQAPLIGSRGAFSPGTTIIACGSNFQKRYHCVNWLCHRCCQRGSALLIHDKHFFPWFDTAVERNSK